ncbi:unnamed protein product [Hermetia illucens]|uniref:Uncharacterized protein n=1 Tax=Hermetia illucens TaxID=343691 RepID=A0A7R8UA80_HERIL|nr:unnamed protein product [Hermetia illucens]
MLFHQIGFIILNSPFLSSSSYIFENTLRNCPMFALFTKDSLQDNDASEIILELASTKILTPRVIITEGSYSKLSPYVNKDFINFVIMPEGNFTDLLTSVHASLQLLNNPKIVFVLDSHNSTENIWNCVQWCWARKFVNIVIAIQGPKLEFDLYTYDPIPSIQIIKIPNNASFAELFPKQPKNFENFPVRTLRKYDFPRTFRYINYKGEEVYGGYLWKIFYTWATKYNVHLDFVNSSGSDVLDRTRTIATSSGSVLEQCLMHSPMFVLFALDDNQSKIRSMMLLKCASETIPKPRFTLSSSKLGRIASLVGENLVSIVIVTTENSENILKIVQVSLKRMHESKIVFLLDYEVASESIQKVVNWCWTQRMINILIVVQTSTMQPADYELYSYTPFPTVTIEKISNNLGFKELFPNKMRNMKGFAIRTVQKYDHPRSFKYINYKGKEVIGGYLSKIFYTFVSVYNASVEIIDESASQSLVKPNLEKFLVEGRIDIVQHFLKGYFFENVTSTSSILCTKMCFLVPQSPEIPSNMYLYLPFDNIVWYMIIFSIIYIALAEAFCGFVVNGKFDFGHAFCNALLGIIYQSTDSKTFRFRHFLAIRLQLMLLGFILTNLFLSVLSSFLTAMIFDPQSDTFEEIDRSGARIMLDKIELDYFLTSRLIPMKWKHLFLAVDRDTLMEQLRILNRSHGYLIASDKLQMVRFVEKYSKRPLFHETAIDYGYIWYGMTIRDDAVFLGTLNKFISRIYDVGLFEKWMNEIGTESVEAGMIKLKSVPGDSFVPMTIDHFKLTWFCLFYGISASFGCFILECIVQRYFKRFSVKI